MDADLIWGIVGTAVGIVGVGAAVYFYLRPREPRADLGYRIVNRPLLQGGRLDTRDIDLLVDGRTVDDPWVLEIELINLGGRPIREGDFAGPLVFRFDDLTKIVQWQWIEGPEPDVEPATTLAQRIGFPPHLLNPGDRSAVLALTSGRQDPGQIDGKVAGIQTVRLLDDSLTPSRVGLEMTTHDFLRALRFAVSFVLGVLVVVTLVALASNLLATPEPRFTKRKVRPRQTSKTKRAK